MTINIGNNTIARIVSDEALTQSEKTTALIAALKNPQGLKDFDALVDDLSALSMKVAEYSNDLICFNSVPLMSTFESEMNAARDFAKVAGAADKALAKLAKKEEAIGDMLSENNDMVNICQLLRSASFTIGRMDTFAEMGRLIDRAQQTAKDLTGLAQERNDALIAKVKKTTATDQRGLPKSPR